jgi:hypothetical protein
MNSNNGFGLEEHMITTAGLDRSSLSKSVTHGAIAGLGGGLVFGMMMAMMGMLPMVAGLVGSQSAFVGAIVHMIISAVIGAMYGGVLTLARLELNRGFAVFSGVINGIIWWGVGALVLMPLGLGMADMLFVIGPAQHMSLIGHLIYGLVTAFLYLALMRRAQNSPE